MTGPSRIRPILPDVTLVAATSVAIEATAKALSTSLDRVTFAKAILLSDRPAAESTDSRIEWRAIAPLRSKADYSAFMLHDLHEHIDTSHALCIQWDGFVLNGEAWDPVFLHFDYIGAVWPQFADSHNVGNGGFSLRSRRLLKATQDIPYDRAEAEDVLIGRTHRQLLEKRGISFAPEQVARRFAYERTPPNHREFGFHGVFNLVKLANHSELVPLFRSLEPQVLNRSEHKELLRWVASKGYLRLALLITVRMLRQKSLCL